jgi:hypothetical protein
MDPTAPECLRQFWKRVRAEVHAMAKKERDEEWKKVYHAPTSHTTCALRRLVRDGDLDGAAVAFAVEGHGKYLF